MARPSVAASIERMDGLYALKPWYAARLRPLRTRLVAADVSPATLTYAGVAAAALGGAALASGHGWLVPPLVALRLAFANLDGAVARDSGRSTPYGGVVNELGDRLADLALLAGLLAVAPVPLVLTAMLAATLPSWVALAGAAHGAPRRNGGPLGKTERCLLVCVAALLPATAAVVAGAIAAGSVATAALRLAGVRKALA
jgi:CDP-diacylglycerol--glycerol-3-phosphate 3-phosphatidyltransferase